MTNEEIISKINEIFIEEFEVDAELIEPDVPLMETLELDSLDLVDIVVLLDTNFGISLKAPDFTGVVTIQDFYNLVISKINEPQL